MASVGSLLWHGIDPWPRNFHMLWLWPENKTKFSLGTHQGRPLGLRRRHRLGAGRRALWVPRWCWVAPRQPLSQGCSRSELPWGYPTPFPPPRPSGGGGHILCPQGQYQPLSPAENDPNHPPRPVLPLLVAWLLIAQDQEGGQVRVQARAGPCPPQSLGVQLSWRQLGLHLVRAVLSLCIPRPGQWSALSSGFP